MLHASDQNIIWDGIGAICMSYNLPKRTAVSSRLGIQAQHCTTVRGRKGHVCTYEWVVCTCMEIPFLRLPSPCNYPFSLPWIMHTHTHAHPTGSRSPAFVCLPMETTWQLERYTLTIHVDTKNKWHGHWLMRMCTQSPFHVLVCACGPSPWLQISKNSLAYMYTQSRMHQ